MKNFIIYSGSRSKKEEEVKTEGLDVEELRSWPGTSSLSELDDVVEGKLKLAESYPSYRIFRFFTKYRPRVSLLVKEKPEVSANFELWQVKDLAVTFEMPRKVARVAVALMSVMLYNDPFMIQPINLSSTDFIRLQNIVKEKSGNLTRLHLKSVKGPKGTARKFEVTGTNLDQLLNIDEVLRSASKIHSLGFIIHPPVIERTLSFRITNWGGGQIYSPPDPLPHEILFSLDLIRQALFPSAES